MSRGLGTTQKWVLAELERRYDPAQPSRWVHLNDLAEARAAELGSPEVTTSIRTNVRRAMVTLADRGLVDWPAYDNRRFRRTFYNRHSGRMEPVALLDGGTRCRLPEPPEAAAARKLRLREMGY